MHKRLRIQLQSQAKSQTYHSRLQGRDLPHLRRGGGTRHSAKVWKPSADSLLVPSFLESSWHLSSCRVHISSVFELSSMWQCFRLLLITQNLNRHLVKKIPSPAHSSVMAGRRQSIVLTVWQLQPLFFFACSLKCLCNVCVDHVSPIWV